MRQEKKHAVFSFPGSLSTLLITRHTRLFRHAALTRGAVRLSVSRAAAAGARCAKSLSTDRNRNLMGERGGFKLCNDPIVHRLHRFERAHHQIASQQFRSLPSPSRTLLTRFKRELAQPTRASIMRLRCPTFLPSTADCGRRSVLLPQEVDARGRRGFGDLHWSRTRSARTAAS